MDEEKKDNTAARIRDLNDRFRRGGVAGEVVVTRGVAEMGQAFVVRALKAVQEFTEFTEDNDPYGEHDFGSFELEGHKLFWKFDLYEDPSVKAADGAPSSRAC